MQRRALVAIGICAGAAPASAGGLALDPGGRAVGRAGASVVADDGAGAVVVNPAALARRDSTRVQLGLVAVDDAASFDPPGAGVVVEERGPSTIYPVIGAQWRLGPLVMGASLVDEAGASRRFTSPEPGQPLDDVEQLHPHRYAGIAATERRRTVAVGAAWRVNDWLAIGGSMTWSRVTVDETRRIWAGFGGRDVIGSAARDVTVTVGGDDPMVPGAALGVLIAPAEVPVELAVAASWADDAQLGGGAAATAGRPGEPPHVAGSHPTSTATLDAPLIVRAGGRWLRERWIAELGGELWTYPLAHDTVWTIDDLRVIDDTGATADVRTLRSQLARRTHGAVRAALDVEVVPGFLWATGGYAWASRATAAARVTPGGLDLGGHTGALGVEIATDGFTVALGWARTWAPALAVTETTVELDNPFEAGTAPTGLGVYDQSRDVVAVTVEMEL